MYFKKLFIYTHFSTSWRNCFCTCTVLDIFVYCNAQKIIHLFTFLVQMTEFGFVLVSCSMFNSILCTSPPFWRASLFLHIFSTIYCIWLIFNFWNCPVLISKLHRRFSSLLSRIFLIFGIKQINHKNPHGTYGHSTWHWQNNIK